MGRPPAELEQIGLGAREALGFGPAEVEHPPPLEAIELPPPRLEPPAALVPICSSDPFERVTHAYGKAYRDLVRALRGRYDHPPDVVARPADEDELRQVLDWCASAGAAAIPYGGGTSVVGGVEPRVPQDAAVTIDLGRLDRVLEVDRVSRAARIQAGATGPGLEEQLKRARADAAPLPAVLRARHAGRLDRDARGRAISPRCTRTSTTSSSPSGR